VTELEIIQRFPMHHCRVASNGMQRRWSRRPTTTSLVAVVLAVLLLLGLARVPVAGSRRAPAAGVVATHPVAGHTAPLLALRALRSRTGPVRAGHLLGAVLSGTGLAVALVTVAGALARRGPRVDRRSPSAGVRGPPPIAAG
jgi:hypothetical protein